MYICTYVVIFILSTVVVKFAFESFKKCLQIKTQNSRKIEHVIKFGNAPTESYSAPV
jgi:hypothetical protein